MLSNWKILAVSCLVAGMGLVQTATLAEAGNGSTLAEPSAHVDAPNAADTGAQYQQRAVSMVGNLSGAAQAAGEFLTVGSTTIRCPKGHCRIEAIMMIQSTSAESDNLFGICMTVNGVIGDTSCPVVGALQSEPFAGFNLSTSGGMMVDLPKGNYDIEVLFYSELGAEIHVYEAFIKSFTRKP